MVVFEGGELERTKSAARRIFPEPSTTISAGVNQTTQTFPSQRRDRQPVFRFAIRWLVSKSKNLFQYKSVKKQRRGQNFPMKCCFMAQTFEQFGGCFQEGLRKTIKEWNPLRHNRRTGAAHQ
jgi:hypothetical protein